MPTESGKPLIVISYALPDEPEQPAEGEVKWLSFVTDYLRPAIKHGAVDLWLDRLTPGSEWQLKMEQKLRACDIFILLVSRHSLSSDVVDNQIKIIRKRQARGETVHFYPLVLTPTHKDRLNLVRGQNLRPRDGKPLSDYPIGDRERQISEVADEIAAIAAGIARRRSAVRDQRLLEQWFNGQSEAVAEAIAMRALLRVVPITVRELRSRPSNESSARFTHLTSAILRAAGIIWPMVKYQDRSDPLRLAAASARSAVPVAVDAYASGIGFAARAAIGTIEKTFHAAGQAADAVDAAHDAVEVFDSSSSSDARDAMWKCTETDMHDVN
jgi:hypothetical protein